MEDSSRAARAGLFRSTWPMPAAGAVRTRRMTARSPSGCRTIPGWRPTCFGGGRQIVRGLEPYTTYRISCFARGTNAGIVWIGGGPGWYLRARFPDGTFGWTKVITEYTTGEDPPDFELMVDRENQTAAVWVDDVRMEAVRADMAKRNAVVNRANTLWQKADERLAI